MIRSLLKSPPLTAVLLALAMPWVHAASVSVAVADHGGAPVEDAAVYLEPLDAKAPPLKSRVVEIEQKDRRFSQLVTVIQVGQGILFPNRDSVRHHVYSLSQAKLFELKLYAGVPTSPVVFEKAGSVVVGCNIHDKMVSYIHVVDTPWFGKSDAAGRARLDGLPDGRYKLKVWHYGLANLDVAAEQVITVKGDAGNASMRLDLRPGAR
jgi:plastocyanin